MKHLRTTVQFLLSLLVVVASLLPAQLASADTAPPSGTPATVSADPLPTVQINGIVWAQVTVGNTVYATGRFTQARPAGVAVGGAGTVARTNLVAYDITTGVMTSFNHSLSGGSGTVEGRAIAASPDGKRLYVGGRFSTVDGQARSNFAAFDLTTNSLLGGFSGTNNTVRAIAASNTRVYIGGMFSTAGGQTRQRLASYTSAGSIIGSWAPAVSNVAGTVAGPYVAAMTLVQDKLVFGGYFNRLNGSPYYSTGAVNAASGAPVAWASQSSSYPIRTQLKPTATSGQGVGITSMSTDGSQVYITAYNYAGANSEGAPEGRVAINPANGNINWINDCHGDSYSAYPIGQVLYSVGHPHDCQPSGGYSERGPQRALAETTYPTGTNMHTTNSGHGYANYLGLPHSGLLTWFPTLNAGTVSGSSQAAWSVTGNTSYISLGGEFTKAENVGQQGLVRYAIASKATNKRGPAAYTGPAVSSGYATSAGKITVSWPATSDQDNSGLTYKLYRDSGTTPINTQVVQSTFWNKPTISFIDSGQAACSTHSYKVVVTDPYGNTTTGTSQPAVACNQTFTPLNSRSAGGNLDINQSLYSNNGLFRLLMQGDGNLVLYKTGAGAIWASNTAGRGNSYMAMQTDGNLVVYAFSYGPTWASNTSGPANNGSRLLVQDDGNVVVYGPAGQPLWSSGTNGR
ncbi:MAG: hypothetical protein WBP26_00810 [Candidatus Saccharimonadales bacterium]